MSESVAAVVVTYNRPRLLIECLAALLRQTRPVDRIVLVDNASSADTPAALELNGYLDHPVIRYLRLSVNTGGAGGFHEGMKQAYDEGFDWIWVMDDDAEAEDNALERLMPTLSRRNIGGVACLTLGPDGLPQKEHRGWLSLHSSGTRAHRTIDPDSLSPEVEISFASFVGLAVHRTSVERIGLPKREMFIKADDLEYCLRLSTLGPLILVADSKIRHKEGVNDIFQRRRRFGYVSNRVPLDKLWLNYFALRNLLWIRRQHCGDGIAACFALRQYLRCLVGIMLFDSNRWIRSRFYWHAICDAWGGVFDNDKPRRLTRLEPAMVKPSRSS